VLLTKGHKARLADFGLAKIKSVASQSSSQGHIVGTLPYIAPEILDDENNQKYLPESDVYSYGILLWEILARQIPWQDKTASQILMKVVIKKLTEPLPAQAPAVLARTVERARAYEPSQRPSMLTILKQLEASPVVAETANFSNPEVNRGGGSRARGPFVSRRGPAARARGQFVTQRGAARGQGAHLNSHGQFARTSAAGQRGRGGNRGGHFVSQPRPGLS